MPRISIITAVHAPGAEFLPETVQGIQAQTLPPGWELEWVVQEDGDDPKLADQFADLEHARYEATGAQCGIAATRNLALARAAGDLVQVLDSDDVLVPGALRTLIPHFVEYPIHWAVGQADDLMPDRTRVPWESALPFGRIPAGQVNEWARAHGGNWPVHCAGLMMRTGTLRALGGWVGLPNDEDIGMFAALSEITDGYNEQAVTWLYRQHPNQVTRTEAWRKRSADSRRFALHRASAVRLAGLTIQPDETLPIGLADAMNVEVGPAMKEQPSAQPKE